MEPRSIGDGLSFIVGFALLLVLLVAVSYGVQGNVTQPVTVGQEVHPTNLSETGFEVIQLDNVGAGCSEETLWDTATGSILEEPVNYSVVSYNECRFNITSYYDDSTASADVAFSYVYKAVDSQGTAVMSNVANMVSWFTGWLFPLAAAIVFLLWSAYLVSNRWGA